MATDHLSEKLARQALRVRGRAADHLAQTLAQHAVRVRGSFSLKVTQFHVTAKFKPYGKKSIVISNRIDPDDVGADPDVDDTLRILLARRTRPSHFDADATTARARARRVDRAPDAAP